MLDPSYDSYAPIAALAGGAACGRSRSSRPDWRARRRVEAGPGRTRVLLLNSPHNPTGRVLDDDELELLAALCREHDLIAVTDEVYEHLVYDGRARPARDAAGHVGAHADGLVARQDVLADRLEGRLGDRPGASSSRACARVKQFLTSPAARRSSTRRRSGSALEPAARWPRRCGPSATGSPPACATAGFEVLPSAGTYFLNADAAPAGRARRGAPVPARCPHEAGVVAIPLSAFNERPEGAVRPLVRFAFCKRDEVLDEAIERLRKWKCG